MSTRIITYGTFDLFHRGHLALLKNLSELGDELIVAVSTDEFNSLKGKKAIHSYEDRAAIVGAMKMVSKVIAENSWEQKVTDVIDYSIDIFAIGDDWLGKFDDLKKYCQVLYVPRTFGISSSQIRFILEALNSTNIDALRKTFDLMESIGKGLK